MNQYSVFTSIGIFYVEAFSLKQALKKFIEQYRFKPDAVYLGKLEY